MAYMDNTTNASFIPTIIAKEALGYFAANMNLARTVSTNFDWTSATEGQVLSIPKRGALTVNQKSSNSSVVVQQPTATNVNVTLNKHFEVTFGLDDVTKVLENQNVLTGYAIDAAKVLAESIESTVAGLYTGLANAAVAIDTTSDTTVINSVLAIRKYFTDQKVSVMEERNVMVSSTLYNRLLQIPSFTQAQNLGVNAPTTPLVSGRVLTVFGMNFWESQLVASTGTSPTAIDHCIAYTKDAFVLASRPLPQVEAGQGATSSVVYDENTGLGLRAVLSYNPNMLAHQVTLDVLMGAAVLDSRRAVEVQLTR